MKFSVDRIEGNMVVCIGENKEVIEFSRDELPDKLKEGDILSFDNDRIFLDIDEATKRKEEVSDLLDELFS